MKIGTSSTISDIKEVKLVMLGSTTVGKTSIVTRLCKGSFADSTSTIGAAFLSKTITVDDITIKFQIWDTSGSERYRSMAPMYFQNADAAIIVYDVTSSETFKDVDYWAKELKEKGPEKILIALVANKADLEKMRAVDWKLGERYAEQNGFLIFKETSALSGVNVNELFDQIAQFLAYGKEIIQVDKVNEQLNISKSTNEKTSACCG